MYKDRGSDGIVIKGKVSDPFAKILTSEAILFVASLSRSFETERRRLLEARGLQQERFDKGILPHFLEETRWIS